MIVSNLKCWSFFFSLDSITIMKVKLLSTMHSRELYDASVFALYAIWFVDMTLHCAVYCCILNWMSRFYSMNTILLSPFNLLSYLSIVTTNELFKTVVAFFLFQTNHKYYNVMTLLSIQMKGNMQYTWNAMSISFVKKSLRPIESDYLKRKNTETLCHYIIYKINHRYGNWK